MRALAPAGDFASPLSLLAAYRASNGIWNPDRSTATIKQLERMLCAELGAKNVALFSSGTAALMSLFRELRIKRQLKRVHMGAYSCPDTVSAALAAGCEVSLVDVNEETLEPVAAVETSEDSLEIVLLSNLYGLADNTETWVKNAQVIVDDGCQSYLSKRSSERVGFRRGVVGVLSFGRGKSLSGVGGGAIVLSSQTPPDLQSLLRESEDLPLPTIGVTGAALRAVASWLLERPMLYWIPSSIPQLELGVVHVKRSVNVAGCSAGNALVMLAQMKRRKEVAEANVKNARLWHEALRGLPVTEPFVKRSFLFDATVVPSRYPILFPAAEIRTKLASRVLGAGLGISLSYGKSLPEFFPQLGRAEDFPGASAVAARLVTLPTHRYVTERDIERTVLILRSELRGA